MTKATADRTLTAVLELDADDSLPQAAVGSGPTLDERVAMFLRAVDGAGEHTPDKQQAARDRILDAMAADMTADFASSSVDPGQRTEPSTRMTRGGPAAVPTPRTWRALEILSGLLRDLLIVPVSSLATPAGGPRMAAMAVVILLVFGAGWSGAWFYSARKAESALAAWSGDPESGRLFRCGSQSLGGFPFRIQLRCEGPQLTISTAHSETVLKAKQLLADASILRPGAVDAYVTGPLSIRQGDQPSMLAHWAQASTSISGASESMSLLLDGLRLERVAQGIGETIAKADHLVFQTHWAGDMANAVTDIRAHLTGGLIPGGPALISRPFLAEVAAVLHADAFSSGLRAWQLEGGRLEISNARLEQDEAVAVAQGEVDLSRNGHLQGALHLAITDSERFAQLLRRNVGQAETRFDHLADWLAPAQSDQLALADRPRPRAYTPAPREQQNNQASVPRRGTGLAGDKLLEMSVRFTDEGVFVGPVLLAKIPVLFD